MDKALKDRIPVLNFLFMVEVMLYHCESPDNSLAVNGTDVWLNDLISYFVVMNGIVCMSFFFLVTGFLLFYKLDFQNLGTKLKKRVFTLLVPYVIWELLFSLKAVVQGSGWTASELLKQIFFLRIWPPLGAFWYLYAVFLLALLSPVLLVLFRRKKLSVVLLALMILALEVLKKYAYPRFGYLGNIVLYLPAYMAGAMFGIHYDGQKDADRIRFLITMLFLGMVLDYQFPQFALMMTALAVAGASIFVFPVAPWMENRKVYRLSFLLLALHQTVISLTVGKIRALTAMLTPYIFVANLTGRIIGILLCLAAAAALRAVLLKISPKLLQVMTGGRC